MLRDPAHNVQVTPVSIANGPVEELALAPDGKRLYLAMGFLGLRVLDIPSGAASIHFQNGVCSLRSIES